MHGPIHAHNIASDAQNHESDRTIKTHLNGTLLYRKTCRLDAREIFTSISAHDNCSCGQSYTQKEISVANLMISILLFLFVRDARDIRQLRLLMS